MIDKQIDASLDSVNDSLFNIVKRAREIGFKEGIESVPKNGNPDLSLVDSEIMVEELKRRSIVSIFISFNGVDGGGYGWKVSFKGDEITLDAAMAHLKESIREFDNQEGSEELFEEN